MKKSFSLYKSLLMLFGVFAALLQACTSSTHIKSVTDSGHVGAADIAIVARDSIKLVEMLLDSIHTDAAMAKVINLRNRYHLPQNSLYQWHNHMVLYSKIAIPHQLIQELQKQASIKVKPYPKPFYNFNRSYCSNSGTAKEWDHIILTANLVADTAMQHQYMQYHATQFQKWPEVSQGFCHANFQQLLVFRNGRQLMLIISIPKGENLDKLNPKTTENNPRVVEWNNIMQKYQEGIAGTKPGEVWVFLKPVSL